MLPRLGCLLLGVVFPLVSQQPAASAIEGRVVDFVTGKPVRGIELTLWRTERGPKLATGRSDAEGNFAFRDLPAGSYNLVWLIVGQMSQGYGATSIGSAQIALTVRAGETLRDVEFRVFPPATITGRVLDDHGQPVPGAGVAVVPIHSTGTQFSSGKETQANDAGLFRITWLLPGRYHIWVSPPDSALARIGETPRDLLGVNVGLRSTPFSLGGDTASPSVLNVAPGQQLGGITISLRTGPLFRIRGRIAPGADASLAGVSVQTFDGLRLSGPVHSRKPMGGTVDPNGVFEFRGVEPGTYSLVALPSTPPRVSMGRTEVEVTDSNLEGVVLPIAAPIRLKGTLSIEGWQAALPRGMEVFIRLPIGPLPGSGPGDVDNAGNFTLPALLPGLLHMVAVSGLPEDGYVKSVRRWGEDVYRSGVRLQPGPAQPPLEVLVSRNGATVEGSLVTEGQVSRRGDVVLLPDPPSAMQLPLLKRVSADQNGRFRMTGVAPGNYSLLGVQETIGLLIHNPDVLKLYADRAVKLSVREGERKQVDVRVLNVADSR